MTVQKLLDPIPKEKLFDLCRWILFNKTVTNLMDRLVNARVRYMKVFGVGTDLYEEICNEIWRGNQREMYAVDLLRLKEHERHPKIIKKIIHNYRGEMTWYAITVEILEKKVDSALKRNTKLKESKLGIQAKGFTACKGI